MQQNKRPRSQFIQVKSLFDHHKFTHHKKVQQGLLTHIWKQVAQTMFGPEPAHILRPYSLEKQSLLLLVPSPIWAQEIRLKSPLLMKRMNAILGEAKIKSIRTKVVTL